MALEGTPIDVELCATDQADPAPGTGPQGSLTDLVNSNVRRFIAGKDVNGKEVTKLRTDKRDGFTKLKNAFFGTSALATAPSTTEGLSLIADASGDALGLIKGQPAVYIPERVAYATYPYNVLNQRLSSEVTYSQNSISFAPDHSYFPGRTLTVWMQKGKETSGSSVTVRFSGAYMMLQDGQGEAIIAPSQIGAGSARRVRTVNDGTYFWIIYDDSIQFFAQAYTSDGAFIQEINWTPTGDPFLSWDIVNFPGVGVIVAYSTTVAGGVQLQKLTTDGATITRTASSVGVSAQFNANRLCTFLRSETVGFIYLAIAGENAGPGSVIQVASINTLLSVTHNYPVTTYDSTTGRIGSACGYSVGTTVVIAYTFLPFDPEIPDPLDPAYASLSTLYDGNPAFLQCDDRTQAYSITIGDVSTKIKDVRGAVVASRSFAIDGNNYCVLYYPDPTSYAPTYFLLSFRGVSAAQSDSDFQRISGEFDISAAYAVELCYAFAPGDPSTLLPNRFHVPSVHVDVLGRTRFPLSYRNINTFQAVTTSATLFAGVPALGIEAVKVQATTEQTLSTVGIKTWSLQTTFNESLRVGETVLLPGACGSMFNDAPTELGIPVPPHVLNVDTTQAGNVTGRHTWVGVFEWTDPDGAQWRSVQSLPVVNTTANQALNLIYTVKGRILYATNKRNLRVALYRSTNIGGVESVQKYKLVSDLAPVINLDDGTATFSFDDNVSDANLAKNEVLYTDQGMLQRYPAPSFHSGCIWQERVCLIGHDNTVWISGAFNPGDGLWWHPAMKIRIPTGDTLNSVRAVDGALVIVCAESVWYCPETVLPDATGQNGRIPVPIPYPFSNGGTGPSWPIREGLVYASSAGGAWLLTRNGNNVWIGQAYQDNLAGTITRVIVDKEQRVFVLVAGAEGTSIVYFDVVSRVWGRYTLPASLPAVTGAAIIGGELHLGGTSIWRQELGAAQPYDISQDDGTQSYIVQSLKIGAVRMNGIRNYKRNWGMQLLGEVHSECGAEVVMSYPDREFDDQEFDLLFNQADPDKLLPVELRAKHQQAAAFEFEITEVQTNPAVLGNGFSLTGLTFYVALEKGVTTLPAVRRYPQTAAIAPARPFPPLEGLVMWLRGDAGMLSSGGFLTSWIDQTSLAQSLTNWTPGQQPATGLDVIDGIPCATFPLADDGAYILRNAGLKQRDGSPMAYTHALTIMAVIKPRLFDTIVGGPVLTLSPGSLDPNFEAMFDLEAWTTHSDAWFMFANNWRLAGDQLLVTPDVDKDNFDGVATLAEWRSSGYPNIAFATNGGANKSLIDAAGVPTTNQSGNPPNDPTPASIVLGNAYEEDGGDLVIEQFRGAIAEVAVWDYDLATNPAVRQQAIDYFARRYPSLGL